MNLFAVEINGTFLTIPPKTSIKLILENPVFSYAPGLPSRTYPIRVSAEDNSKTLNFANALERRGNEFSFEGKAYLGGQFYRKCTVIVDKFSEKWYDVRVLIDRGYFRDFAAKRLKSFALNNPSKYRYRLSTYPVIEYTFSYSSGVPDPGPSVYLLMLFTTSEDRVNGQQYRFEFNPSMTLAEFLDNIVAYINARFPDTGIYATKTSGTTINFYDLWSNDNYPDISFSPEDLSYYDYLDDPTLTSANHPNPWLAETNHATDTVNNPENYDYVFYPVLTPEISGVYDNILNHWTPAIQGTMGVGFREMELDADPMYKNTMAGFAKVYNVFKMIHDEANIKIQDNFWDDELKTLTFYNPIILHSTHSQLLTYHRSFKMVDLLPEITVADFLLELSTLFCSVFDYRSDRDEVHLVRRVDILNAHCDIDWTDKLIRDFSFNYQPKVRPNLNYTWASDEKLVEERLIKDNLYRLNKRDDVSVLPADAASANLDLRLVIPDNWYYVFQVLFTVGDWVFLSEALEGFFTSEAAENIQTTASTLFSETSENTWTTGLPILWKLPYTKGFERYRVDAQMNPFPSRYLFYRGLQPCIFHTTDEGDGSPTLGTYPFASYHNYNYQGDKIGNYSLAWNAEDGLINVFWKDWAEFIENSSPIDADLVLTVIDIMEFDIINKIMLKNQEFLISQLEVEFVDENIKGSRATLYQRKSSNA
ncbi:MAG: hypothetical protein WC760_06500 [Bacteroidia bacterium]|jgi:hypothetical protein